MEPAFFSTPDEIEKAIETANPGASPIVYIFGARPDLFEIGLLSADGRIPMNQGSTLPEADILASEILLALAA